MVRLEQIAAVFLAAALAFPSYWFFWSLAGGGGYDRRSQPKMSVIEQKATEIDSDAIKAPRGL